MSRLLTTLRANKAVDWVNLITDETLIYPWRGIRLNDNASLVTAEDMPDGTVKELVADQSVIVVDDKLYMFLEYRRDSEQDIYVGESTDGITFTNWQDAGMTGGVNMEAAGDASYPRVFWDGSHFYATVTGGSGHVYLLQTTKAAFPLGWTGIAKLISQGGVGEADTDKIKDPSIMRHNGYYWMQYLGRADGGTLDEVCIAYARDLLGPWTKHPSNPVLSYSDLWGTARSFIGGGGLWRFDNRLYSFLALDHNTLPVEFTTLTPTACVIDANLFGSFQPIIGNETSNVPGRIDLQAGVGSNPSFGRGSHHFSPVYFKGKWFGYFDTQNPIDSDGSYSIGLAFAGGEASAPSPQNRLVRSEEFTASTWAKGSNMTVTADATAAPVGEGDTAWAQLQACSMVATSTGNGLSQGMTNLTAGVVYTFRFWVKDNGSEALRLEAPGVSRQYLSELAAGEWNLVSVQFTAASSSGTVYINNNSGGAVNAYVWGAQVFAGADADTPYVRTLNTAFVH